jgi:hypothetical protein
METTKRFARTLREAFPNDSQHRAEYGCAIIRTARKPSYLPEWVMLVCSCVLAGYLLGKVF